MARKKGFLSAEWSKRWDKSYERLDYEQQRGVDKVVMALLKQEPTPGMRIKPVEPEKHYKEARANDGDRVIFRVQGACVWFVDVVAHDDIKRYGKQHPGLF